jgi:hypothetical protein
MGTRTTKKDKTWDSLVLQVVQIRVMARIAQLEKMGHKHDLEVVMGEAIKEETTRVSRQMRETLESMIARDGQMNERYCKISNRKMLQRLERKGERAKA